MEFFCEKTEIPDLLIITHEMFEDDRGFFVESYRQNALAEFGLPDFVQDNHSRSVKGVLRGLHYQLEPKSVGKLVRCMRGEIFDVAVDIRQGSPAYGQWFGLNLSQANRKMLYVPPGFAHGFLTLSDNAEVFYKMSGYYSQEHDRGMRWNDPAVGVVWPDIPPLLSEKDAKAPTLAEAENNLSLRH
jgi:dTDP-4-dehydrorhamnose 3,5-epimerase